MPPIEWSNEFSVNVRELDNDHKELIKIINEFDGAVEADVAQEVISKVLDDLMDFAEIHFKREEALMKQYEFHGYLEHKYRHNGIFENLFHIYRRYKKSEKDIASRIAALLGDWLLNHTLKEDKKVGEFLNSKGLT